MLFLIASIIRYQTKTQRQELLDIDSFDDRVSKLNEILTQEIERISELVKRADTYNRMDKEERKEAIRTIFRRLSNKRGSSRDDELLPTSKS